jgi:hypothetical protein
MPRAAQIYRRRPVPKTPVSALRAPFWPFLYSSASKSKKLYLFMGRADKKTCRIDKYNRLSAQKRLVSLRESPYRDLVSAGRKSLVQPGGKIPAGDKGLRK